MSILARLSWIVLGVFAFGYGAVGCSEEPAQPCDLGSCTSSDGGVTAADGGENDAGNAFTTSSDFCADLQSAFCDFLLRCDAVTTRAACQQEFPAFFDSCSEDSVRAHAAGRATFDGSAARRCVDAMRSSLRCVYFDFLEDVPDCAGAFTGTVPAGGSCYQHVDCVPDAYCTGATTMTCPGTCEPRKGVGEKALFDRECQAGLYVYGIHSANPSCQVPAGLDQSCAPLPNSQWLQHCADGLSCDSTSTPAVCKPEKLAGAPCSPLGFDCDGLYWCDGKTATCGPLGDVGASCNVSGCKYGLHCEGDFVGSCVANVQQGAACAYASDCIGDTYCEVTCQPQKGNGEPCANFYECAGGACTDGVCGEAYCHDPAP